MFGSARRRKHAASPLVPAAGAFPAEPIPAAPLPPFYMSPQPSYYWRDLHAAAEISTLPMPYDIGVDHEGIIIHLASSFPVQQIGHALHDSLAELAAEAGRRGCTRVYGVQHQLAVHGDYVLVTMLGTGARPVADLDSPGS